MEISEHLLLSGECYGEYFGDFSTDIMTRDSDTPVTEKAPRCLTFIQTVPRAGL